MSDPTPESFGPHTVLFADVRARLLRVPFEPFRVVTTSGHTYDVPTADHAGTLPLLRTVQIARDDGSAVSINALHIAAIETLPRRAA